MLSGRYRVAINGFRVQAETWDDVWQWDGKHDEVFVSTAVSVLSKDGTEILHSQPTSPVMGDTYNQAGRIQAGSAGDRGGLKTGDSFPSDTPWLRGTPIDPARDWPPCSVWEGELADGENVLVLTPTIWEWDPGGDPWSGWINWADQVAKSLGPKVGDLIGGTAKAVTDAISLGLDAAVKMFDVGGPMGNSGSRPIGMQQTGDPKGTTFQFNPQVFTLNYRTAELLVASEPSGRGKGVLALRFVEHPYFRGDYMLYVQVEKIGGAPADAWETLAGGDFAGGPGIVATGVGQLEAFGRGTDNSLFQNSWRGSWQGWQQLDRTVMTSDPSLAHWGQGRIEVVARLVDNACWVKWWAGGWSPWVSLSGPKLTSGPAVCSTGDGKVDIFGRSTDSCLWHIAFDGTKWTLWERLDTTPMASDPATAHWGGGHIEVVARLVGSDAMWVKWWWDGWSPWTSIGGGPFTGGPAVCSAAVNSVDILARGIDNSLQWKRHDGQQWHDWVTVPAGPIASDPDATSWGGRVDVVALSAAGNVVHKWYDGGSWYPAT